MSFLSEGKDERSQAHRNREEMGREFKWIRCSGVGSVIERMGVQILSLFQYSGGGVVVSFDSDRLVQ
jgi:hypothetical protein